MSQLWQKHASNMQLALMTRLSMGNGTVYGFYGSAGNQLMLLQLIIGCLNRPMIGLQLVCYMVHWNEYIVKYDCTVAKQKQKPIKFINPDPINSKLGIQMWNWNW